MDLNNPNICLLRFQFTAPTIIGEEIVVVGNIKEFGFWEPTKGLKLETDKKQYPFWSSNDFIKVSHGAKLHYKLVIMSDGKVQR